MDKLLSLLDRSLHDKTTEFEVDEDASTLRLHLNIHLGSDFEVKWTFVCEKQVAHTKEHRFVHLIQVQDGEREWLKDNIMIPFLLMAKMQASQAWPLRSLVATPQFWCSLKLQRDSSKKRRPWLW